MPPHSAKMGHPAEYAPANQGLGLRVCLLCPMRSAEIQLPCIQARKRTGHARHRVHRNRCATRRLMKINEDLSMRHSIRCHAGPCRLAAVGEVFKTSTVVWVRGIIY